MHFSEDGFNGKPVGCDAAVSLGVLVAHLTGLSHSMSRMLERINLLAGGTCEVLYLPAPRLGTTTYIEGFNGKIGCYPHKKIDLEQDLLASSK